MNNAICEIYVQKLTATKKYEYVLMAKNVSILISPASQTILTLYPDLPVGESYSFLINKDNSIVINDTPFRIPPQSKIVIKKSYASFLAVNDIFITKENSQVGDIGGNEFYQGICIKQS